MTRKLPAPIKVFITNTQDSLKLIADLRQGKSEAALLVISLMLETGDLTEKDIINYIVTSEDTDASYALCEYIVDDTVRAFLIGGINALKEEQLQKVEETHEHTGM